jgi:hypothetical protein
MLHSTIYICDGIQTLIEHNNLASSNALLRPLLEYTFRFFWLNRIATEEEIEACINKDRWPATNKLHDAIKGKDELIDTLTREKMEISDILHSYTHGGNQNPLSHIGKKNLITHNMPNSDIVYVLNLVRSVAFSALHEMTILSSTNEFNSPLDELIELHSAIQNFGAD